LDGATVESNGNEINTAAYFIHRCAGQPPGWAPTCWRHCEIKPFSATSILIMRSFLQQTVIPSSFPAEIVGSGMKVTNASGRLHKTKRNVFPKSKSALWVTVCF